MNKACMRRREIEIQQRNYALSHGGELAQIEAIARHYVRHAQNAVDLLELIKMRRYGTSDAKLEEIIRYLAAQIRENHALDLGIELAWPKPKELK